MNHLQKCLLGLLLAGAIPYAAHAASDADDASGAPHHQRGAPHDGDDGDGDGPRGHGPFGGPRGHGPGPGFDAAPPFLRALDLTEAQQDRIFAILHGDVPYLRDQAKAHDKAEQALFDLHGAVKYDDAAAAKLAQASAQAMANITLQHLRTEQKVLAVLTPEQRKEVDEHKARPGRPPRP